MNDNATLVFEGVNALLRKRSQEANAPFEALAVGIVDGTIDDPAKVLAELEKMGRKASELQARCDALASARRRSNEPPPVDIELQLRKHCRPLAERIVEGEQIRSVDVQNWLADHRAKPGHLQDAIADVKRERFLAIAHRVADGEKLDAVELAKQLERCDENRRNLDYEVRRIKQEAAVAAA